MNQDFLIVTIIFVILTIALLIHHRIKHHNDIHLSREEKWFQIEDVWNGILAHEKFVFICALLSIGFGVAYAFS